MKKQQQGFTLLELMIVTSILGVLSTVGISSYQDYTIRAQVSEGLVLAAGAKRNMIEDYLELGAWPSNNNKADLANLNNIEGRFVKSIKAQKNVITIMYGYDANPAIFHEKITFTATETNGNFSWTCESAGKIPEKYLPRACR